MSGQNTYHDGNNVAVIAGVSSADGKTIVLPWVDPITHRLLTSSTGITFANETPSGLINGSNVTYTLANTPTTNSLVLTVARQPQILGVDYTITGNTITFLSPVPASLASEPFNAIYAY